MAYSAHTISRIGKAPKTLGNQLGRWATHHGFSAIKVSKATGASRQSVYNWFHGGEVFVAYRPAVQALLKILQTSPNGEEAWRKTCKAFNLKT
jgi:hypothetical protein